MSSSDPYYEIDKLVQDLRAVVLAIVDTAKKVGIEAEIPRSRTQALELLDRIAALVPKKEKQ